VPLRPGLTALPLYRADGGDTARFCLRVASVAGIRHRLARVSSDDAYAWALLPEDGGLVLGVADGIGSVSRGGQGAELAVAAACRWLAAGAADQGPAGEGPAGKGPAGEGPAGEGPAGDAVEDADLFAAAFAEAQHTLEAHGDGAPAELSTTLVLARLRPVVLPEGGAADGDRRVLVELARVGDSTAWTLLDGAWHELFAGPQAHDLAGRATFALPAPGGAPALERVSVQVGAGAVIVLTTDGVGDPLRDGPETVAPGLAAALRVPPAPLDLARAADFSRRGCSDDRTILAVWVRAD
jgi:serine/threonine protein phosphatase PrpC